MAFDEALAERVRSAVGDHPALTEKKMFGGIAFMIGGNMAVGVSGDSLMVRVPPDEADAMLEEPGVRPFDLTGKPMKGWILVDPVGSDATGLLRWVDIGVRFAESLPAK